MADDAAAAPAANKAIWTARLSKELKQLEDPGSVPEGVTHVEGDGAAAEIDLDKGVCSLRFQLRPPSAAAPAPGAPGVLDVAVDLGQQTNYPFAPPTIHVLSGQELLPRANVAARDGRVTLPALNDWTPKSSLLDLLAVLLVALERGNGEEEGEGEGGGGMTEAFVPGQALSTAKFVGPIFPCSVRQQGGQVLLRYVGVAADEWMLLLEADRTRMEWVVVLRAEPVLNVAKLKYRRGEAITVVFKGAYVCVSFCVCFLLYSIIDRRMGFDVCPLIS